MIKIVFCLKRLPALSQSQFVDYWYNHHAPLVRSHQTVLRIRRYVQAVTVDTAISLPMRKARGAPEAFDGLAELWFDSKAEIEASRADPAAAAAGRALIEDERRFIDLPRSPLWFAEEREIIR